MVNSTGANLHIIDTNGEIVATIKSGERFTIRSGQKVKEYKRFIFKATQEIKGGFTKVMGRNLLKVIKGERQLYAPALALSYHIQPITNAVTFNGKKYGVTHLAGELGISRTTATKYMGKLKDLGVIKSIKIKGRNCLVANPHLFCKSKEIMLATIIAFKEDKWQG